MKRGSKVEISNETCKSKWTDQQFDQTKINIKTAEVARNLQDIYRTQQKKIFVFRVEISVLEIKNIFDLFLCSHSFLFNSSLS